MINDEILKKRIKDRRERGFKLRNILGISIDNEKAYLEIRKEIAIEYAKGYSTKDLSERYMIGQQRILNIVRSFGIPIRKVGRPKSNF